MSKFTADTMKKAWAIRRAAAVKFGCRVSEVSWKECLKMATPNAQSLRLIVTTDVSNAELLSSAEYFSRISRRSPQEMPTEFAEFIRAREIALGLKAKPVFEAAMYGVSASAYLNDSNEQNEP